MSRTLENHWTEQIYFININYFVLIGFAFSLISSRHLYIVCWITCPCVFQKLRVEWQEFHFLTLFQPTLLKVPFLKQPFNLLWFFTVIWYLLVLYSFSKAMTNSYETLPNNSVNIQGQSSWDDYNNHIFTKITKLIHYRQSLILALFFLVIAVMTELTNCMPLMIGT